MKKQFFFIYALALMAVLGFQGLARGQTDVIYCSTDASYQAQFISSVKVGSIYNITLLSPGGYADYTSLWTAMAKGSGYPITVTNGFGFVSDQCAIWVDWNQDGDFTDAGEQITVNNTPGLGPYTATITPPTAALNGNTRMRVRLSGQGSFNSCGTTMYGETEDYTINVGGTSPVNDIGVIDIITPATGTNLGSNETVKVWVYNFGTSPQAGFSVSYKVNNGTPVTETISASIAPGAYYIYSFTQKVNMSGAGVLYNLKSYATLTTDENHNNDTITRSIFHGWAQNAKIVQGEYFINTDPGTENGTSIAGTYNLVNVTVNINNLNLPVGSRVYVRFKSTNGTWSSPQSFKRNNYLPNSNAALASAEYFINTDPGQGNGTSTNLNNGITNITNLNLPVGSAVYVRVKDDMGRWGKPMSIKRTDYFPNTGATLNYAEYFINTDPGKGNGTPITLNSGVANITNLNMPIGSKIFVRVKDNLGRWSIPMGSERKPYFTNTGAVLSNAEYFINTDPGQGNGTPVTVSGGVINISNLNLPVNSKVYVRVKDNLGRWSMPYGMIRYVYYTIQGALLPYAEYFINTDPGQGNGIPLTIDSAGIMQLSNLNFPVNQVVYIRVKDSFNRWSFPRGYKSPPTIITPGSVLAGGEYFLNTDPGNGNGIPLTFLSGTANIDSLALHRGDVLYVRAKDTYNRWGPSRALKYHFKDMQSAEYKIKLASNGSTTLPLPMTLLSAPDSTCTWIATKDTLAWHANDTIWVRFQDKKDGLYSAWKRGVIANAGQDKIICQGEFTNLTATGGTSYLWSNGMTGASITVSPTVNTKYWVYVSDGQGDSSVDTVSVNVNPLPVAAGPIAGITEICAGNSVETYSVPVIANATSYIWTLPHGATGSSTTNSIVVNYTSSVVSGYITVKGINSCGIGLLSSLGITVNSGIAGPAGIITGQEVVCQGENNVEYSIEEISNAESYVWSLPQGVNIVSGYNSNSIVVNFTNASISGSISVYGTNICGSGLESPSFNVEVDSQIGAAGNIAGMATVCQGQTGIAYSVQPIANATGYVWSVPSGTTIIEGNNTNLIFVNFSQAAISGDINVYGVNACGNGTISPNVAVTVNPLPGAAGTITGAATVCQGQNNVNYFVPAITNATDYIWSVPIGATIIAGNNTNSIIVGFSNTAVSGNFNVYGYNDCGNGTVSSNFTTIVNPLPSAAGNITGSTIVCQGQNNVNYSVPVIMNATGYVWTLPEGAIITAGSNTHSITVNYSNAAVSGSITVYGTNSCGNGIISSAYFVTVYSFPDAAETITGTDTVCQGQTNVNYSVPVIVNATGYVWTLPSGATITSGNNTNAITVNYSNTAISGNITVYGTNSCGNGIVSQAYTVIVNPIPVPTILGPDFVCAGSQNVVYTTEAGMTNYFWLVGAWGFITSGQGTNTINVAFAPFSVINPVSVSYTNSNGCAGWSNNLMVSLLPRPLPTILGDSSVCFGATGITYSTDAGMTNYLWSVSSGGTITSGIGTNQITVTWNTSGAQTVSIDYTNSDGCTATSPTLMNVNVNPLPDAAGIISGSTSVCQGQTGIAYSVQPIANATGYVWSVPSGTTIIEGNNTNLIFVNFSQAAISGDINVYGVNACGNGTISPAYPVMINALPDTAGEITGTGNVYQGQKGINYSLPEISNATSYNWTLPLGATIVSGLNTNSITVDFSGQALSGYIMVNGINDCGSGYQSVFPVSVMPSHFAFEGGNPADPVWTIYISQAILDGLNLQPMDEIAVFDGATMVSAFTLTEVLTSENWSNQYITAFQTLTNGQGYTPGNLYTFKCWDASAQKECDYTNVTLLDPYGNAYLGDVFPSGDGEYSIADIEFLTSVTHSFNLNTGYQFISSYITPPNPDMSVVLAELMNNNLSFVRSSGGDMFRKLGPNWVNNIGNWIITEGYLVKMNAPDDFNITGTPVDPHTPINLNTGYQFISYLHDYPMNATIAFAGIMNDNLSFIRNSGGDMLRKLGPNWVNNIGNVNPGEGYLVKMNAPATLIYPTGDKSILAQKTLTNSHFIFEGGNAADPVYTIYISDATINGYSLQAGDEIGVFDGQTLVGSLALTQTPTPENQTENAIPVFATLNSGEGFTANHPVTFKIWSASQGMEYNDITATMSNPYGDAYTGNVFPNSDGIYSIASLTTTLTGINNPGLSEIAVYPNPNNGTFTLEFKTAQSQTFDVKIYNSLGVVVYQQLNVAANGKYSTEISLGDLPEGIYTLNVISKHACYVRKMVIKR